MSALSNGDLQIRGSPTIPLTVLPLPLLSSLPVSLPSLPSLPSSPPPLLSLRSLKPMQSMPPPPSYPSPPRLSPPPAPHSFYSSSESPRPCSALREGPPNDRGRFGKFNTDTSGLHKDKDMHQGWTRQASQDTEVLASTRQVSAEIKGAERAACRVENGRLDYEQPLEWKYGPAGVQPESLARCRPRCSYGLCWDDVLQSRPGTPAPSRQPQRELQPSSYLSKLIGDVRNTPASLALLRIIESEKVALDTHLGLKLLGLAEDMRVDGPFGPKEIYLATGPPAVEKQEPVRMPSLQPIESRLNDFAEMLNVIAETVGVNLVDGDLPAAIPDDNGTAGTVDHDPAQNTLVCGASSLGSLGRDVDDGRDGPGENEGDEDSSTAGGDYFSMYGDMGRSRRRQSLPAPETDWETGENGSSIPDPFRIPASPLSTLVESAFHLANDVGFEPLGPAVAPTPRTLTTNAPHLPSVTPTNAPHLSSVTPTNAPHLSSVTPTNAAHPSSVTPTNAPHPSIVTPAGNYTRPPADFAPAPPFLGYGPFLRFPGAFAPSQERPGYGGCVAPSYGPPVSEARIDQLRLRIQEAGRMAFASGFGPHAQHAPHLSDLAFGWHSPVPVRRPVPVSAAPRVLADVQPVPPVPPIPARPLYHANRWAQPYWSDGYRGGYPSGLSMPSM